MLTFQVLMQLVSIDSGDLYSFTVRHGAAFNSASIACRSTITTLVQSIDLADWADGA
jgi:hypothetical protein